MNTHQEYGALQDRMTRVEVKLDLVLGQLGGTHQDHETRLRALEHRVDPGESDGARHAREDHEKRLRRVERWMWAVSGAAAVLGGAVGSLFGPLVGA